MGWDNKFLYDNTINDNNTVITSSIVFYDNLVDLPHMHLIDYQTIDYHHVDLIQLASHNYCSQEAIQYIAPILIQC